jgi:hypothetical protein
MLDKARRNLDLLDLELLERALEDTRITVPEAESGIDLDRDNELEAALRRELIEIAHSHAVSDPDKLKDILLAGMPPSCAARSSLQD